jgi:hypothetical protein
MDGMTMLCRPTASDLSTAPSTAPSGRPSSRDSHSETSFSSQEGPLSPVKQELPPLAKTSTNSTAMTTAVSPEKNVLKKKSGFFQNHSPFRRKSTKEVAPTSRNTWHPGNNNSSTTNNSSSQSHHHNNSSGGGTPGRQQLFDRDSRSVTSSVHGKNLLADRSASPDPIDANASLALNVGQNVFPVHTSERNKQPAESAAAPDDDPIAMALAELKGVTAGVAASGGKGTGKPSLSRMSADHYHGIATPAPGSQKPMSRSVPVPGSSSSPAAAAKRGTPPPSYDQQVQVSAPVSRLGVPPPAVTSRAMKESSQKFQQQTRSLFSNGNGPANERPGSSHYGGSVSARSMSRPRANDVPRAASPAPPRSASPRPASRADSQHFAHRSASPNPASRADSQHYAHRSASPNPAARADSQHYAHRSASPNPAARADSQNYAHRSASPNPYAGTGSPRGAAPGSVRGTPQRGGSEQAYYRQGSRQNSPAEAATRGTSASPSPYARREYERPNSSMGGGGGMGDDGSTYGGSQRGRTGGGGGAGAGVRPGTSSGSRGAMSFYEGAGQVTRQRSKSVADPSRQYTRDGRPIIHFGKFSPRPSTISCSLWPLYSPFCSTLGFSVGPQSCWLQHQANP